LAKEDWHPEKLYIKRRELLDSADEYEECRFKKWQNGHALFMAENQGDDYLLHDDIRDKIGFQIAKKKMRQIKLEDMVRRLPEVATRSRCMSKRTCVT
jgi:hypothetical protein